MTGNFQHQYLPPGCDIQLEPAMHNIMDLRVHTKGACANPSLAGSPRTA